MEADSTTYENIKESVKEIVLPFSVLPGNYRFFTELVSDGSSKNIEIQIIERLQGCGLIPKNVKCTNNKTDCKVVCKPARVVDRLQWMCESCGVKQPIRKGSFFMRLQCSILQVLQIILAWTEDADLNDAAQQLGIKGKVASQIYDKLDELAIKELSKCKLGGENSVVLAELYPDCLNRLSPDTTDQPHSHRILMLADTNHFPTHYSLHVIKDPTKKISNNSLLDSQFLKSEVERIISEVTKPNSMVIVGTSLPAIENASTLQQLAQCCDVDMQHFLSTRVWRYALSVCAASRDLCSTHATHSSLCAGAVQRYLHTALYRHRYDDGFYQHILQVVAQHFTEDFPDRVEHGNKDDQVE